MLDVRRWLVPQCSTGESSVLFVSALSFIMTRIWFLSRPIDCFALGPLVSVVMTRIRYRSAFFIMIVRLIIAPRICEKASASDFL
jgi:hypothetical protein